MFLNGLPLPSIDVLPGGQGGLLDLRRMAKRLGVSARWLRDQAEAGHVPALPAGPGRLLFNVAATEAALAALASSRPLPE